MPKKHREKPFGELLVKISSLIQKKYTWKSSSFFDECFPVWIWSLKLTTMRGTASHLRWWLFPDDVLSLSIIQFWRQPSSGFVKRDNKYFLIIWEKFSRFSVTIFMNSFGVQVSSRFEIFLSQFPMASRVKTCKFFLLVNSKPLENIMSPS